MREGEIFGGRAAAFGLLASLLLAGSGCGTLDNCPEGQGTVIVEGGTTDLEATAFDSAPGNRQLDAFPAKTTLRFEHELGATPDPPEIFLSFTKDGPISMASGDTALITCLDAHVVEIKNNTCENFFVRVLTDGLDEGADPERCATSEP